VCKAHSKHAKHALCLGGSGGMPPQENFEKIDVVRLNLVTVSARKFHYSLHIIVHGSLLR